VALYPSWSHRDPQLGEASQDEVVAVDGRGRPLDVHIAGRFAITYWDDFADRHVKIMDVDWADDVL